jgi:acylphosphatase
MERANIVVSGLVQGVFFRAHTQREAAALRLTGWVRNLNDGRVEILVEGEKDKVEKLISAVRVGPPMSRVEAVDVSWMDYRGDFTEFRVTW